MRLGTCLLFEGRTLQGAHPKLAYFCSAPVAGFYAAVDSAIKREDKELMGAIQDNMFTFENLGMSDDRSLQTLLRALESEDLIMAMKGAPEDLQEKLFGCMSSRAAANIKDEMEVLGPVRLTEVQTAQKKIIEVARKMSDEGTIVLAGRGGDEMV